MATRKWLRPAIGLGMMLALDGISSAQESLDAYYAYPVSVGLGYQPLSAIAGVVRKAAVNDISLRFSVPLPFMPAMQPSLFAGVATLDSDESDEPTILGGILDDGATIPDYDERGTWDHQLWCGGLGMAFARRISKEFEAGADIVAGLSMSYFSRRVVTSAGAWYPVGELGMTLGLGGKISLNPSYNLSIDLTPAFRYHRTFGTIYGFDGLYFGIGFAAHYRFGQDPDAPMAEVHALKLAVEELPPVFAAMQKVYVKKPIASVIVTSAERDPVTNLAVSFNQATYMDSPTLCAEIDALGPGESVDVPIRASFNDAVFGTVDVVPLNGEIIAGYTYHGPVQKRRVQPDGPQRRHMGRRPQGCCIHPPTGRRCTELCQLRSRSLRRRECRLPTQEAPDRHAVVPRARGPGDRLPV